MQRQNVIAPRYNTKPDKTIYNSVQPTYTNNEAEIQSVAPIYHYALGYKTRLESVLQRVHLAFAMV